MMTTMTYNLGPVALLPVGEGRMFTAGDLAIAVFRTRDGQVHATEPWCPHRGGPLADGLVAADRVLCPLHGYAFELTTGRAIRHECGAIQIYPIRVTDDGHMLVTIRPSTARQGDGVDVGGAIVSTHSAELQPADV
jgi:nitrite reductase (NADH) small subunit